MSEKALKAAALMNMLPDRDQAFALEFLRKLVLAWDPDYTRLTEEESAQLKAAEEEIDRGETIAHDAIDWDA